MRDKWVDIANYIGPDRRRKRSARWSERREDNLAGNQPPLGTLLRRLRVHILGLKETDDRSIALSMIAAATAEAERTGLAHCAAALRKADHVTRRDASLDEIDRSVSDAMDHESAGR